MKKLLSSLTLALLAAAALSPSAWAAQLISSGGSCADIQGGNTADGTPMIIFHCHGSPNQSWVLAQGTITGAAGTCLDVMGSTPNDGAQIIVVQCNGRPSQKWQVAHGQVIGLGGKCLDIQGGGGEDRTPLVLQTCSGASATQQWTIQ